MKNMETILGIAALIIAVMIHEISHGLAALWCGDSTAKEAKRLSLNPVRHIDPIGTIVLPVIFAITRSPVMFGWAKPVPVNLARTRNPRQAFWIVSIAGPMSNLLQSLLGVGIFHALVRIPLYQTSPYILIMAVNVLASFSLQYSAVNIVLMTFNLIPIPPLDGSKVLASVLPYHLAMQYLQIERFGFIIIYLLLQQGVFSGLINGVLKGFFALTGIT